MIIGCEDRINPTRNSLREACCRFLKIGEFLRRLLFRPDPYRDESHNTRTPVPGHFIIAAGLYQSLSRPGAIDQELAQEKSGESHRRRSAEDCKSVRKNYADAAHAGNRSVEFHPLRAVDVPRVYRTDPGCGICLWRQYFLLVVSLVLSLYEIAISTKAIEIELEGIEQSLKRHD
jgi:hypothetical protein